LSLETAASALPTAKDSLPRRHPIERRPSCPSLSRSAPTAWLGLGHREHPCRLAFALQLGLAWPTPSACTTVVSACLRALAIASPVFSEILICTWDFPIGPAIGLGRGLVQGFFPNGRFPAASWNVSTCSMANCRWATTAPTGSRSWCRPPVLCGRPMRTSTHSMSNCRISSAIPREPAVGSRRDRGSTATCFLMGHVAEIRGEQRISSVCVINCLYVAEPLNSPTAPFHSRYARPRSTANSVRRRRR